MKVVDKEMKKIISMFMLWVFSVFNNVEYIPATEKVFTDSSYYHGEMSSDGVLYKDLYGY